MKKIISLIIAAIFLITLAACEKKVEASRDVIDYRYTPAHEEVVTEYEYKYDGWKGEFRLMPNTHTKKYNESYELLYKITYTDGSSKEEWQEVTEKEYSEFKK